MGGLHEFLLPEAACPQAGCMLESFDAAGIALDCGDPGERDDTAAEDGTP